MRTTMSEAQRAELIESMKSALQAVIDNMDSYIPDAVVLEDSTLTVEVSSRFTTRVRCDFEHLV